MHVNQHASQMVQADVVGRTVENGLDLHSIPDQHEICYNFDSDSELRLGNVQHCSVDIEVHAKIFNLSSNVHLAHKQTQAHSKVKHASPV
jgi:hypothetical protein